jgi:glycine/D-amino acid oxidase-like deaminating enzyme
MSRRLLVLGGGFYGAAIAAHRARQGDEVTLLEARQDLMTAASTFNQARVHGGYHYPRALTTAARSQAHYADFMTRYAESVSLDFVAIYAIARGSKTTSRKFRRMCDLVGAPLRPAPPGVRRLFSAQTVDDVWVVREAAFHAGALREQMRGELARWSVDVRLGATVLDVVETADGVRARVEGGTEVTGDSAIVAFYGESSSVLPTDAVLAGLQFESCELVTLRVPEPLQGIGVTLMDGPYFSLWPFPLSGTHSLSHVRYTPHGTHATFEQARSFVRLGLASRADRMVRDAARYVPSLRHCVPEASLWGVKTVPSRRERDDGRPILVRRSQRGRVLSVLGSKLDNVADALIVSDRFSNRIAAERSTSGGAGHA